MQEGRYQKFLLPVYLSVVVETFGGAKQRYESCFSHETFQNENGGKSPKSECIHLWFCLSLRMLVCIYDFACAFMSAFVCVHARVCACMHACVYKASGIEQRNAAVS